jgi:hypothetical protein
VFFSARPQLGKYKVLNDFEQQTSVPKVYVVLGLGALYFFLVFFNIAAEFLVNTIGFAIPAYYSLNALFSANTVDDTQWLTYWVVYAFFSVFESAVSAVYWFPFYYTFKFVLILWMALPQTKYVCSTRPFPSLLPFRETNLSNLQRRSNRLPILPAARLRPLLQPWLDFSEPEGCRREGSVNLSAAVTRTLLRTGCPLSTTLL